MQHFNLYITDPQRQQLEKESAAKGISLAELIRRILDEHFSEAR